MMSFTKGLPHAIDTRLIKDEDDFELFKDGICLSLLRILLLGSSDFLFCCG